MFEIIEVCVSILWGEEFLNILIFIDMYKGKIIY